MDDILAVTLRSAVHHRLDYLDKLATDADLESRAALADTEIVRLTSAWRTLLAAHQPDERGRCPECSGWPRPRRHPCSVWTIAHQHLIAADGPPARTAPAGMRLPPVGRPSRCWGPPDQGARRVPDRGTPPGPLTANRHAIESTPKE